MSVGLDNVQALGFSVRIFHFDQLCLNSFSAKKKKKKKNVDDRKYSCKIKKNKRLVKTISFKPDRR